MDKRFVIGVFSGFVGLGVVYGLMAVVMGTPPQAGPVYSYAEMTGDGAPSIEELGQAGWELTADPSLLTGEATASAGATGSAGMSGSAGVEDTDLPRADQPARVGQPLAPVENPPPDTTAMLDPAAAKAGTVYDITFAPFGTGPEGTGGPPQLVIKVIACTPRDKGVKTYSFANSNVLANVAADSVGKAEDGGQYQAVLTLVDQEGLLVPELSRITVIRTRK